jgi:hypothetical protein
VPPRKPRRASAAGARRAWRRRLAADLRFDGEQPGDALQRRLRDRRLGRGMQVIELAPRMPKFVREWPRLAGQAFLTETSQSCRGVSYTQEFALSHIDAASLRAIPVSGAGFNFETETWETATYTLPWSGGDFVLLTPKDLLTRDENWINRHDLIRDFENIPAAIPDAQLRAQVTNYFERLLSRPRRRAPTQKERNIAAAQTIRELTRMA